MQIYNTYYPNGKLESEVLINNGKKEGLYKKYDENGEIIITCHYINDKICGIMNKYNVIYLFFNINEIIEYKEGIQEGKYIQLYKNYNNQIYNIYTIKNNKKNGHKITYHENEIVGITCNYQNDKRNGRLVFYDYFKTYIEIRNYINDKIEGKIKIYDLSGNLLKVYERYNDIRTL